LRLLLTLARERWVLAAAERTDNYIDDCGDVTTGILKVRTRRPETYSIGFTPCTISARGSKR
jgi:hypothetical protein